MSFWREPELPPVQKMPRRRASKRPSYGGRVVAGLTGLVLLAMGAIGAHRALKDPTGTSSPVMALAVLLPAVLMIRYALTGQIKVS